MADEPSVTQQYAVGDFIAGEFKVLAVLGGVGKSGQGVVYLVDSRDAPQPFVLKTFQELGADSKPKLVEEAKVWVALGYHPNLVPVYWVRELDFKLFVAAEFVRPDTEGRITLEDHILEGPQPLPRICKWIVHFCDGMSFAMNQGLMTHGDIKPSNLLIDPAGILRITDFGLAKFVRAVPSKTEAAGTLLYMAPEQFVSPGSASFKADIYAIGIVLYQLVRGGLYAYRMPEKLFAVEDFARIHLSAPVSRIDTPFWSVLEKCLSKNAARRPSFDELRREVIAIAGGMGLVIEAVPRADGQSKELYAKAQSLTALGEGLSALGAIEEYTRRFPQHPWGWTEKGVILLHLDQVEEAIAATRESLRLDPANSHAWNNLGIALNRRGEDAEATTAFRKALEHDPYNTGSMMSLANILVQQGESKTPARLLLRALKLHPKKKTLLRNAANIAAQIVKNGGLEEARELLECVTENEPTNVQSWFNLALVYQASKKTSEAIKCYRRVVDLEPTDSTALTFLAKRLAESGEFSEAIEICERCLQIGTKRGEALVLKAQFLNAQGHYSSAVRLLTEELTINPNADMLWFVLATIHEANGALREAQSAADKCKSILAQEKRLNSDNYLMVDDFLRRLKRTS